MADWTIYLSGEIHSDWRERIRDGALKLPKEDIEAIDTYFAPPALAANP